MNNIKMNYPINYSTNKIKYKYVFEKNFIKNIILFVYTILNYDYSDCQLNHYTIISTEVGTSS